MSAGRVELHPVKYTGQKNVPRQAEPVSQMPWENGKSLGHIACSSNTFRPTVYCPIPYSKQGEKSNKERAQWTDETLKQCDAQATMLSNSLFKFLLLIHLYIHKAAFQLSECMYVCDAF